MGSSRKKENRTLPDLQKQLNFKGTDETFKKYVNSALMNRGPIYQEIFKLYYGIDCKKLDIQDICDIYPGCDVPRIRILVWNRLKNEIPIMISNDNVSD